MLKLIYGKAKTGKTEQIISEIKDRVQKGEKRVLLIVPEQFSHEAERELCDVCGDGLSMCAEVISFTRLYRRVMDMVGGGREFMDKSGRVLALNRALAEISSRLKVYNYAQNRLEMQSMILHTISELKTANITDAQLLEESQKDDSALHTKLADLSLILSAYNAVTSHSKFDPADRMSFLAENINRLAENSFSAIYIDGFIDFTVAEREVIKALIACSKDITVALTLDDLYEENEVFEASRKTALWLSKIASDKNIELKLQEMSSEKEENSVDIFRKYLFGYTPEKFVNNGISLMKCDNIVAECEFAAAKCRELVAEGARYKEIVIAVRGFGDYRPSLECAFEQYDVPYYAAMRSDIMKKPLPMLVSSAIEASVRGYMYEDIFAYLKTGLTGIDVEEIDRLENYCITWDIKGKSWEKDFELHPEGYNRDFDDRANWQLESINKTRKKVIKPLIKLRKNCEAELTAANMARSLNTFFADINLPKNLQNYAEMLNELGQEQRAAEYEQLWDIITKSLEQVYGVLGDLKIDFETFGKIYRLMLSQCDVGSIPVSLDRVTVGELERVRRRRVKHLILLGASDQNMPKISDNSNTFSPEERRELAELGFEIGSTVEDELARELNAIYNCISLPSESMSICYSTYSADKSKVAPSFVMTHAMALFDAKIHELDREKIQTFSRKTALILASKTAENRSDLSIAASEYFKNQYEGIKLENARKHAISERGRLSKTAVKSLYGENIRLSASRTDKFNSCRFAYFLQYGLRAKPRQKAGFNPPEMGSFIHFILENTIKELNELGEFKEHKKEEVDKITVKYVKIYIKNELNDFRNKTKRFKYLFNRLTTSVKTIVWDMVEELANSEFKPLDFELEFSSCSEMSVQITKGNNENTELVGTVDRIDGWVKDDKLYLRVIDYKTGKKSFDLSDVWYGMGMQMLMYLFALERQGENKYRKEIVPTGVLYIPARDAAIHAKSKIADEEIFKEHLKNKRRSGLIINDEEILYAMEKTKEPIYIPVKYKKDGGLTGDSLASAEQLGKLSRHIEKTLKDLASELRSGSIAADPFYKNVQDNACLYCDYIDACYFSEKSDCKRKLTKLKAGEVWNKIDEEVGENG